MAERAESMEHFSISPSAALMAKVTELRRQGKDIISLNVGEPDFETPAHIRQAAADAMNSGFTHYTTESGIPELRQAIIRKLREENGVDYGMDEMDGVSCPDVHGAFYVYPDVSAYFGKRRKEEHITNSVELCRYLLDEALVAVVPGEAFNLPGKIRISYSNSMENLKQAMDRIEAALKKLQ